MINSKDDFHINTSLKGPSFARFFFTVPRYEKESVINRFLRDESAIFEDAMKTVASFGVMVYNWSIPIRA
ncbi:hypothetical protein [Ligilactobacillus ruminis]|uniref:hypothetical protein n=1 Tax=Ligilactobacillus ruminis TaxID=1623 RepID=UPI0023608D1F|nr:hypothetical protein [Ligilactobacillus ruminis]WDC80332.1 hypothetical protein PSR47_01240 [Ligilactobacillus ruminis]